MLTWLAKQVDAQMLVNNSSRGVEVGRVCATLLHAPTFGMFILAVLTKHALMGYWESPDIVWYEKIIFFVFGFLAGGAISAYGYVYIQSEVVAWLFGLMTVKRKGLTPGKVMGAVIILALTFVVVPYMGIIGAMGIVGSFGDIDWQGLMIWGAFVSFGFIWSAGLLMDPQTMAQKRRVALTDLVEAGRDAAADEIRARPQVAFKMFGMNEAGDMIRDPGEILAFLNHFDDASAVRTANGMINSGHQLYMPSKQSIPPIVYYEPPSPNQQG